MQIRWTIKETEKEIWQTGEFRIDQLEKRQTQDDATINVINRYWNQLNEDIRVLLQRFDAETGDELEKKGESESTTSFLAALSTWHKEELDERREQADWRCSCPSERR